MQQEVKPVFDNKAQFDRISPYIIPGETLYAVYDCKGAGTGFVGVTDQRVIFFDQEVLTFGKHKSMVSIPYNQVVGVAAAAGRFSFEFRGADKALWVYRFIMNQILFRSRLQIKG